MGGAQVHQVTYIFQSCLQHPCCISQGCLQYPCCISQGCFAISVVQYSPLLPCLLSATTSMQGTACLSGCQAAAMLGLTYILSNIRCPYTCILHLLLVCILLFLCWIQWHICFCAGRLCTYTTGRIQLCAGWSPWSKPSTPPCTNT